jgi:hypothetical protein
MRHASRAHESRALSAVGVAQSSLCDENTTPNGARRLIQGAWTQIYASEYAGFAARERWRAGRGWRRTVTAIAIAAATTSAPIRNAR